MAEKPVTINQETKVSRDEQTGTRALNRRRDVLLKKRDAINKELARLDKAILALAGE